jgi:spectrin alpha
LYPYRQHKLDDSLAYQQFSANVDEEVSWINEKNTLVGSDDYGDTLAAVQVKNLYQFYLNTVVV